MLVFCPYLTFQAMLHQHAVLNFENVVLLERDEIKTPFFR